MTVVHVSGKDLGKIMLYALSTCVWCQKTRTFLNDLGVEYDYEYVDLLEGDEREKVVEEIKKWNPACSFPTMILNSEKCVVGYKEDEIREELSSGSSKESP
jgi:glutaredoxin